MKNTAAYDVAAKALKQHGSPEKAVKQFMQELRRRDILLLQVALEFLNGIKPQPAGPQAEPSPTQAEGSVKVKPFNVPGYKRRTHEEKQIALLARDRMAIAVYESRFINGKAIGDLAMGELRTLVAESALMAGSRLFEGKDATVSTLLLNKIANYAAVDDMNSKVRDVVPPEKIREMIEEAETEAPLFIQAFIQKYADSLKRGEIAEG
jgi:hypothetical protein